MANKAETFRQTVQTSIESLAGVRESSGLNAALKMALPPEGRETSPEGQQAILVVLKHIADASVTIVSVAEEVRTAFANRSNKLSRIVDTIGEKAEMLRIGIEEDGSMLDEERVVWIHNLLEDGNAVLEALSKLESVAPKERDEIVEFLNEDAA